MTPIIIVVSAPELALIALALALPYVALGVRALTKRAARTVPEQHGLRNFDRNA